MKKKEDMNVVILKKKKKILNKSVPEIIIWAIPVLISIFALVVSLKVAKDNREFTENASAPHFNLEFMEYKNEVAVKLSNKGEGGGIIKDFTISKDGNPTAFKSLDECIEPLQKFQYKDEEPKEIEIDTNLIKNYKYNMLDEALSSGDEIVLFSFISEDPDQIHAMRHAFLGFGFEIKYVNIHERNEKTVKGDFESFRRFFEY